MKTKKILTCFSLPTITLGKEQCLKTLTGSLQHQKEGQSLFTSGFINEKFIGVT
jgi:hypothetical protein